MFGEHNRVCAYFSVACLMPRCRSWLEIEFGFLNHGRLQSCNKISFDLVNFFSSNYIRCYFICLLQSFLHVKSGCCGWANIQISNLGYCRTRKISQPRANVILVFISVSSVFLVLARCWVLRSSLFLFKCIFFVSFDRLCCTLLDRYYRKAAAALVVHDITSMVFLKHKHWQSCYSVWDAYNIFVLSSWPYRSLSSGPKNGSVSIVWNDLPACCSYLKMLTWHAIPAKG